MSDFLKKSLQNPFIQSYFKTLNMRFCSIDTSFSLKSKKKKHLALFHFNYLTNEKTVHFIE